MATLLSLPPELRLQIYRPLLSRQPYRVYLDEFFAIDSQPEWIQLKQLMKHDSSLVTEISRLYWRSNIFMVPEVNTVSGFDDETGDWINDHVKANLKDLRSLEFGVSARCNKPHAADQNPVCYNVVHVDLLRGRARFSMSGRRGDGCEHVYPVIDRLNDVLTRCLSKGNTGLTQDGFWALYKSFGG